MPQLKTTNPSVLVADQGEMSEWSKEHAWKVCVLQKGTVGSNPTLSAENEAVNPALAGLVAFIF